MLLVPRPKPLRRRRREKFPRRNLRSVKKLSVSRLGVGKLMPRLYFSTKQTHCSASEPPSATPTIAMRISRQNRVRKIQRSAPVEKRSTEPTRKRRTHHKLRTHLWCSCCERFTLVHGAAHAVALHPTFKWDVLRSVGMVRLKLAHRILNHLGVGEPTKANDPSVFDPKHVSSFRSHMLSSSCVSAIIHSEDNQSRAGSNNLVYFISPTTPLRGKATETSSTTASAPPRRPPFGNPTF